MNLSNLGWVISDLFNTMTTMLVVAVVVILLIVALKYEYSRKFIFFGICFVLIVASVFAVINIYSKMTTRSFVNGKIEYVEVNYKEVITTDLDPLLLYPKEYGTYYFDDHFGQVEFDGTKNNYEIYVNGMPTNNKQISAGFISADFIVEIYDVNNKLVATPTIKIRYDFYSNETLLTLTANITAETEAYLKTYVEDNGFKITVAYAIFTPVVKVID